MTLLQLNSTTNLILTLEQVTTILIFLCGFIAAVVGFYFKLLSKIKDNQTEIDNINTKMISYESEENFCQTAMDKKFENIIKDYNEKLLKLEENSKQWYKQSDANYDKLNTMLVQLTKGVNDINTNLRVHLAECKVFENNESKPTAKRKRS